MRLSLYPKVLALAFATAHARLNEEEDEGSASDSAESGAASVVVDYTGETPGLGSTPPPGEMGVQTDEDRKNAGALIQTRTQTTVESHVLKRLENKIDTLTSSVNKLLSRFSHDDAGGGGIDHSMIGSNIISNRDGDINIVQNICDPLSTPKEKAKKLALMLKANGCS